MMKIVIISFLIFGTIVPNIIFGQTNRISIYTGLFHEYFDGTPMVNINYHNNKESDYGFFQNRLYNSFGIQYLREINAKSGISIDVGMLYKEWSYVYSEMLTNVIADRHYFTFNINYRRKLPISNKFNFTYGGGVNYRRGDDFIVLWYHYFNQYSNIKDSYVEVRGLNDFGINLRTGIEYTPIKWLTLYTKFNFITFFYFDNGDIIEKLQNNFNDSNYPNWFDLSWRFGVGFNFGKK